MLRLLSFVLVIPNLGLFLLLFIVSRDVYRETLVYVNRNRFDEVGGFRIAYMLQTIDMVAMIVMGLAALTLTILIQSRYENSRGGRELAERALRVAGVQLLVLGSLQVVGGLVPGGIVVGFGLLTLAPLLVGAVMVSGAVLLRRAATAAGGPPGAKR